MIEELPIFRKVDAERLNVVNAFGYKVESKEELKRIYGVYGNTLFECTKKFLDDTEEFNHESFGIGWRSAPDFVN